MVRSGAARLILATLVVSVVANAAESAAPPLDPDTGVSNDESHDRWELSHRFLQLFDALKGFLGRIGLDSLFHEDEPTQEERVSFEEPIDPTFTLATCMNIYDFLKARPDLSTFLQFLEGNAKEIPILQHLEDKAFQGTLFVPSNNAFIALSEMLGATIGQLLTMRQPDRGMVLELHIVPGLPRRYERFVDGMELPTLLARQDIFISVNDEGTFVEPPGGVFSRIIEADNRLCAAVVHIVDAVLLHKPATALQLFYSQGTPK